MTWSFHVPEQGDRVRLNDATVAARVTRLLAAPDAPAAAITLHVNDKAYRIGTARASVDPEILEHSGLVVDAARVAEWSGLAPDTYISRDGLEDQRNTVRLLAALLHDMNDVEATAKVENLGELKLAGSSAAILLAPYIDFSDHVLVVFAAIVGTPFLEESTSVMKVKGRGRILAKRLVRHEAMQTLDLRKLLGEVTGKLESEGIAPIVIPDTLRELPPGQT